MGLLSSLFGGGGGSDVEAPSLDEMRPESAQSNGLLFNTSYDKEGTSSVGLTDSGQQIADEWMGIYGKGQGIADKASQKYDYFNKARFADRRYELMRNRLNRDDVMGTNRAMATMNAMTGGVGATAGTRQSLSQLAAEQGFNRESAYLNLLQQGDVKKQMLFGNMNNSLAAEGAMLGNYQNFLGGGENVVNRDLAGYFNQAGIMSQQAMGEYQADLANAEAEGGFFDKILGTAVDLGLSYATGGTSSLFSGATGISAGNMFSGGGGSSLSNTPGAYGYVPTQNNALFGDASMVFGGL